MLKLSRDEFALSLTHSHSVAAFLLGLGERKVWWFLWLVGLSKEYLAVSDTHNTTQKKFFFILSLLFFYLIFFLSLSHNISLFVIVIVSLWLRHHQKPHKASFSCLPQHIRYDTGQFLCFSLCILSAVLFCCLLLFFVFTWSLGFFYSAGVWRFSLNCESEWLWCMHTHLSLVF